MDTARHWANDIYDVFKCQHISLVSYVPDAGHVPLLKLLQGDPSIRLVSLTTEEEGVALAAGAYLGGVRSALLMQSSGVGNIPNMCSLLRTCGIPFLTLITMRGEYGEFNPWQVPMGQATPKVLEAMGFIVHRVEYPDEVGEVVHGAARLAFNSYASVAVLLSQRLIGAKKFAGK